MAYRFKGGWPMAMKVVDEVTLFDELKLALSRISAYDLRRWGAQSVSRLPMVSSRRIQNFGSLLADVTCACSNEATGGFSAWKQGNLSEHMQRRTATGIDTTIDIGKRTWRFCSFLGRAMFEDPRKHTPGFLALALGFVTGSGGIDGNGGIPDTDIAMFGIDDHRSVLTHSILAGIVVELAVLAVADLAGIVCDKLPEGERSEFWSSVSNTKDLIAACFSSGASAGIAYHLTVDASLQPAAYKDLPLSMPLEVHQLLFALNAAVEGNDAVNRGETTGTKVVRTVSGQLNILSSRIRGL